MTDDPKLQMARRLCRDVPAGAMRNWAEVKVLAAIEECTERAASHLEEIGMTKNLNGIPYMRAENQAAAVSLRSADHLKGPTDGS